jgi:hypothetical protein
MCRKLKKTLMKTFTKKRSHKLVKFYAKELIINANDSNKKIFASKIRVTLLFSKRSISSQSWAQTISNKIFSPAWPLKENLK